MLNNYASLHVSTSKHFSLSVFSYVKLHGASFLDVWCLVASSCLIGGSRTLQIGIRAHVAAWASMGRENQRHR